MSEIFVFGSNRRGFHGAGAAKYALENCGAKIGIGEGLTGNSYAIPTKDKNIRTLPLDQINIHVARFIHFAYQNPHMKFRLTAIGCGLAGYTVEQIAPMFGKAPLNVRLPPEFKLALVNLPEERFWSMSEFESYAP